MLRPPLRACFPAGGLCQWHSPCPPPALEPENPLLFLIPAPTTSTSPGSPLRLVWTLSCFPTPPASCPCGPMKGAASPRHLRPLSLGPNRTQAWLCTPALVQGVGRPAWVLPTGCPQCREVGPGGAGRDEFPTRSVPQPFRTLVLSLAALFEPTVTYSPRVPRSGSGPVGAFCGGLSGEGTYCCLLQCLPRSPLTSVLSLPGKRKVSSPNRLPGSLVHRLEPNFSTSFS